MKLAKRSGLKRLIQALWIGVIAAGLMLGPVAASNVSPNSPLFALQAQSQVEPSPTGRYFIFFDGESALQATKANKGQIQSALVQNQVANVRAAQVQQLKAIEKLLGRKLKESKHFDLILNAIALPLSLEEAQLITTLPGVKAVVPVKMAELTTDAGPAWVSADLVWNDSTLLTAGQSMGEGVVIGVLDTGINFDHPSFASDPAISGDSYVYPTPTPHFGVCNDPTSLFFNKCNDKLIGAYYLSNGTGITSDNDPEDIHGHGSHTASIAAGNREVIVSYGGMNPKISGMAPHAKLIAYDVCHDGTCSDLDLAAGVQQAVQDGVDVINYSISSMDSPYFDPIELAFLEAQRAGIFISAAAANASGVGPTKGMVNHLGPWVSTVAATSHNRRYLPGPDVRAYFSLQGPADFGLEVLKPDLAAPGILILAASKDLPPGLDITAEVEIMSGTSMATPFVAGAAALLISAHPDWTPAEVKSALMLTAKTEGMFKDTSGALADPFDIGSGRIQVDKALTSGLVMDETAANMESSDPALGGDPKTLNLPTMQNNFCFKQCSWTRTLRSVSIVPVTYTFSSEDWISVEPTQFTIEPGGTQSLRITAQENILPMQQWLFAQIALTPNLASLPTLHLTAAVLFTPVIYYYFPYLVN